MVTENAVYEQATETMNDKAKYKLANWLAHGFEIKTTQVFTVLEREDQTLMLDHQGNIYTTRKAI